MLRNYFILFTFFTALKECKSDAVESDAVRKFPDGFQFGTATASYQIEGAWDEDGKSESIWDHFSHSKPCTIRDCETGDTADDSYHQYQRDVEMLRELGVDYYRFSLSWPRILPTSFPDQLNSAGIRYYNNLIDELLKYDIEPIVTVHHWDLPQKLQVMGGWNNPDIINWYKDFARTAFALFGDRVRYWITINEPNVICEMGYGKGVFAPGVRLPGIADYSCTKNILMAHAAAYHIYNDEFKPSQGGQIGITIAASYYYPASDTDEDIKAAEDYNFFEWQKFAHPIFSDTGDFPKIVKDTVAVKSEKQGFMRSRQPQFTEQEVRFVKGTSDFYGLNHYSSYLVYRNESEFGCYGTPSFKNDAGISSYQPTEWKIGASNATMFNPSGFYYLLGRIREQYNNPTVFILENGFATYGGLDDKDRVQYIRAYLDAMLDAIEDGSDISRYTVWSLMDNFEWSEGYKERFGLYEVDYEDPSRPRTARKSAFVFKEIVRSRSLDPAYEPNTTVMTIEEH